MQMVKILVIDDDRLIQMILKGALQAQGYEVIIAENGKEGISLAQQCHPALIICDWIMPEIDGLEVCRYLKQNETLSTTFFILLTAKFAVEDKVEALNAGADDFLSKPIEKSELIASVRAGLRIYQLNHDLQIQKQILESELAEASEYVRSLLPTSLTGDVNVAADFIPSSQLGGDCYDFYWLDNDHLVFYLIDTSGHGVGSALHSISILNLIRSRAFDREKFYDPGLMLSQLNRDFQMSSYGGRYFTMWYGVFQRSQRKLTYANAGHPPGLLFAYQKDDLQFQKLPSLGMPIGFFPTTEYKSAELFIAPNSKLYIFSDGIFEIKQADGQIWGLPRFIQLMSETISSQQTVRAALILERIRQQIPNTNFVDDISLIELNFA